MGAALRPRSTGRTHMPLAGPPFSHRARGWIAPLAYGMERAAESPVAAGMNSSETPAQDAHKAGLRYVSDEQIPGITRHGAPGRFTYRNPAGRKVTDHATLGRIRALAIPPAWRAVWIAPFENSHLAANGRDARGRKQYRYHAGFAAMRDAHKFEHLALFAQSLPQMRRRLARDLKQAGLPKDKVLALLVTLLEETLIRIGNEDYARANKSFGLTTLRNRHVTVKGGQFTFLFQGKSGKTWNLSVRDRRVAKMIRSCQELPGQHLFEYRGEDGAVHPLSSSDVNDYLRAISGREISAKDFRTWAGTVRAAAAFAAKTDKPTRKHIRAVVAEVAEKLGNTVAVCRKCYIHPAVITGYEAGGLKLESKGGSKGLSAEEAAVLAFLRRAQKRR
jgi:DNA topoisomerase-1